MFLYSKCLHFLSHEIFFMTICNRTTDGYCIAVIPYLPIPNSTKRPIEIASEQV